MRLYVALALGGLPLGAMYALQALGIVVIYKTSRVFTFATGAVGMLAAYVASWLSVSQHVPVGIAVLAATLTGVGVGLVMEALTIRPVRGSVNRTVVTLVRPAETSAPAEEPAGPRNGNDEKGAGL